MFTSSLSFKSQVCYSSSASFASLMSSLLVKLILPPTPYALTASSSVDQVWRIILVVRPQFVAHLFPGPLRWLFFFPSIISGPVWTWTGVELRISNLSDGYDITCYHHLRNAMNFSNLTPESKSSNVHLFMEFCEKWFCCDLVYWATKDSEPR